MNGVDQGVAFSDLPLDTPLYGAVSLYEQGSKIIYNVRNGVYLRMRVFCVFKPAVNLLRAHIRVWRWSMQLAIRFHAPYPWEIE